MNVGSRLYTPGRVMVEVDIVTTSGPEGTASPGTEEMVFTRLENWSESEMVIVVAWMARRS
jgi:hypothetical protein